LEEVSGMLADFPFPIRLSFKITDPTAWLVREKAEGAQI
jgi:hypothetical protein